MEPPMDGSRWNHNVLSTFLLCFGVVLCLGYSFSGLGYGDVLFRISSGIVG